jgi:hypothetical protein
MEERVSAVGDTVTNFIDQDRATGGARMIVSMLIAVDDESARATR